MVLLPWKPLPDAVALASFWNCPGTSGIGVAVERPVIGAAIERPVEPMMLRTDPG